MTSWAPTSHKRANGAGVGVGFTPTTYLQALYDLFDTDADGWEIAGEDSPTTGFTVTPVAAGDSQEINFRNSGSDTLCNLAPSGGITNHTAPSTGSPTNLSPDITATQDNSSNAYTLFLHEWEDAFWIFQIETGPSTDVSYPRGMFAGVHLEPLFASDKNDGITGHVIGAGNVHPGAASSTDVLADSNTDPQDGGMALTGPGTWNSCGVRDNVLSDPSSVNVGGRSQPAPTILYKNPGDRPIGVARYLFRWMKTYYAGDLFRSNDGTREAHAIYESTSFGAEFVVPMELGFNQLVHAT